MTILILQLILHPPSPIFPPQNPFSETQSPDLPPRTQPPSHKFPLSLRPPHPRLHNRLHSALLASKRRPPRHPVLPRPRCHSHLPLRLAPVPSRRHLSLLANKHRDQACPRRPRLRRRLPHPAPTRQGSAGLPGHQGGEWVQHPIHHLLPPTSPWHARKN